MNIPILRIPFPEDEKRFINQKINEVLDSGVLTMGKYTQEFEELFRRFVGSRYAVSTSNCTVALEIIIRSLGIEGKSIIIPTNTFMATAYAVMQSGNKVIFADSDRDTLSLYPKDLRKRIDPDTAAVVLVHIGGIITPDYYEIKKICEENNLYLIEDCAHAFGCSIDGKNAGLLGVAGAFSFFPTKVVTTGEGGMITTDDEDVYNNAMMIRNHGKNPAMGNRMSQFGYNYRLSEITAVIGIQQMRKAAEIAAARKEVAGIYDRLLAGNGHIRPLSVPSNTASTYYKYIAFLPEGCDRSKVKRIMKEKYGVSLTGEVYADPCHTEPIWKEYTYCGKLRNNGRAVGCTRWPGCGCKTLQDGFPEATYLSNHHICLPLYPGLTEKECAYVVDSLLDTVRNKAATAF
jgi:dTDP-4-amino-4,6-dideoxygalactose transaminase